LSPVRPPLALAPLVALGLAAVAGLRWWAQGAGNVYTDLGHRFYVPDPDLGWRLGSATSLFLGLDAIGVLVGLAVAIGVATAWLLRHERRRGAPRPRLRAALLAVAALGAIPTIAAIASGGRPEGGRDRLPAGLMAAPPTAVEAGAGVPLAAGRWTVAAHPGSRVIAGITAGGERFEGRFASPRGEWRGDPADLTQPMSAAIEIDAGAIDTGVSLRSKHAVELLDASHHPAIRFTLDRLEGARTAGNGIAFSGRGSVTLMGRTIPAPITGTLRATDAAAQARLGVGPALVIAADTTVDLRQTPLAGRAGDFDSPRIDVHVDLILRHVH
jgi:polyisoprenoid-binding protein YceI